MTPILPFEIINYILSFAPIKSPSAKCIKRVIYIYNTDHNWYYIENSCLYNIKNIMSFYKYYYHSKGYPNNYLFGPNEYNKFKN
uniref:Uncharacterized protein n=1 Tax=viral metagenome TaxID=1070528 RepID=A0A6C0ISA5_9ZZZZ